MSEKECSQGIKPVFLFPTPVSPLSFPVYKRGIFLNDLKCYNDIEPYNVQIMEFQTT